jgi:hypothetical protein
MEVLKVNVGVPGHSDLIKTNRYPKQRKRTGLLRLGPFSQILVIILLFLPAAAIPSCFLVIFIEIMKENLSATRHI